MASGDTIGLGRPCRICIDPGHGGRDTGAVANGVTEKVVNLSIAGALKQVLTTHGHTVAMTRTGDDYVGLTSRGCFSVNHGAELFVSVHHDWMSNPNAGGVHAFAHRTYYKNGMDLATWIATEVRAELGIGFSYGGPAGQHWVNLGVMRGCSNAQKVTAALIECCTLTRPEEAALTQQATYAARVALALARGIHQHLGLPAPGEPQPVGTPIKVVRYGTETVLAEYVVVPDGDHIEDQRKLYVE